MIDAIVAGVGLLLEGLRGNPAIWILVFFVSVGGAALLVRLRNPAVRRSLVALWAILPALVPGLWTVGCTAVEGPGEACFGPGFAFAIGLTALPVWTTGTIATALLTRRRRRAAR